MALQPATFDSSKWDGIGVNCQLLFRLLGDSTIVDIFRANSFRALLSHCRSEIAAGNADTYILPTSRKTEILTDLSQLIAMLSGETATLEDLITGNKTLHPAVLNKCDELKRKGCFFVFNHIPAGMHHRPISLINQYGFLETGGKRVGTWTLGSFLTTRAKTGANATPHFFIARKAKQAGIFKLLANPFAVDEVVKAGGIRTMNDGNGKCCDNGNCVDIPPGLDPDDFYCEHTEDTPPVCNSLADPCP